MPETNRKTTPQDARQGRRDADCGNEVGVLCSAQGIVEKMVETDRKLAKTRLPQV